MDVANLRVLFNADGDRNVTGAIDRVNRGLDSVDGHARKAGSALDSVWKITGGVLVARGIEMIAQNIVGMAGGLLAAHSNAEQLRVSLDIAVGSAAEAGKIFGELQKIAAATPFQFPELVESAVRLEAFGVDSLSVMDTLGDTAAGLGKDLMQVTAAYLDAGMGQFVRLQELGIDASVVGDEVVLKWIENGEMMTKAVDKNNANLIRSTVAAIWNNKYEGAMAKQSRTFAGQWSTLKDNAMLGMMGMTEGIFSSLTEVLDFANIVFSDGLSDALRGIEGPLGGLGDTVAAVFDAFGSGDGVDDLMNLLFGSGSPMAGAGPMIQGFVEGLLNISDALGDMKAAFDTGGLGGLADVFGEEMLNILGAGVDIGVIAVRFAWGELVNVGESLYDKVVAYAGFGTEATDPTNATASLAPFTTIDVIVAGAVKLAGDFENIADAIVRELGLQRSEADLQEAEQAGYETGQAIIGAVLQGIDRAATESGGVEGGSGDNPWESIVKLLKWEPAMFRDAEPVIFDEAFRAAVGLGRSVSDAVDAGLAISEFVIGEQTSAWNEEIIAAFEALDFSVGVNAPNLPSWLTTDWSWITGPIETLTGYISDLLGLTKEAEALTNASVAAPTLIGTLDQDPFFLSNMGAGRNQSTTPIGVFDVPQAPIGVPFVASYDDDAIPAPLQDSLRGGAPPTFPPATATFLAEHGDVALKYTDVMTWGGIWADSIHEATFDADNGPAAIAYTNAFTWGGIWAEQTFTASFSIDTSGLAAARDAALYTAQYMRDILPNSPAKIGPLAGATPSLDYIADSFRASFERMRSEADTGMAGVRGAMNGSGGTRGRGSAGRSGFTNYGPTYVYPASGDVQREWTSARVGEWRDG